MPPAKRCLCVASATIVLLVSACGGDGDAQEQAQTPSVKPARPGVSALSYSPKPFSKDMTEMRVRFTTTGPAGPGRRYQAWLWTGLDKGDDERCYPEYESFEVIRGKPGGTYEVTLAPDDEYGPMCAGHAQLVVWTEEIEGRSPPRHAKDSL